MANGQTQLFKRTNHSHLGRDWESALEAVHEFYRLRGLVDIVKNDQSWSYCGENDYATGKARAPGSVARDGNNRPMRRMFSNVDYSGGNATNAFCFDAKTCDGNVFPLSNIHPHQVHRLKQSSKCGTIAGFMIRMAKFDRVFFVWAFRMEQLFENWQKQSGRRAKPGTASLNMELFEEICSEIKRDPKNGLWDWLPVLSAELPKRV